jgi:hypothetical protein
MKNYSGHFFYPGCKNHGQYQPQDTTLRHNVITQDAYPLVLAGPFTICQTRGSIFQIITYWEWDAQFINKFYFIYRRMEYNYNAIQNHNIGGTFINTLAEYYHVDQTEYTGS